MPKEFDKVQSSGTEATYETGAVRDICTGKGMHHLIPPIAIHRLARHYENGSKRYGKFNWQKGIPLSRYLDSAMRHLLSVMEGLDDEDHEAAVLWNMAGYIWTKDRIEKGKLPKELNDLEFS